MKYFEAFRVVGKDMDDDRIPELTETFVCFTCDICGSVIRDTAVHTSWHKEQI